MNITEYRTVMNRYEDSERIKQIGPAWTFTNSEFVELGCKRKWSYGYLMNIETTEKGDALLYGIVWHVVMEHALLRMKNTDTCITKEEALELIEIVGRKSFEEEREAIQVIEEAKEEWIENCLDRMKRAIVGWCDHWAILHKEYEIIAIEQTLARPILHPQTGEIYSPKTYIIEEDDCLYPAGINKERSNLIDVCIPYWKVGKADAILLKRGTKSLYILDHKTTSQPTSYERKFLFDMQLSGYCSLLDYEIKHGDMTYLSKYEVKGVIWDLCHSKVPKPPEPLKSGKLSTAKAKLVPSWIYEESIIKYELDRSDYEEHLEMLKTKADPNYFCFLITSINENDMTRSVLEDYSTACSMHELKTKLINADNMTFQYTASRYPICQQYLSCKYSYLCQPNVAIEDINETIKHKIYWKKIENNTDYDIINSDQLGLPF